MKQELVDTALKSFDAMIQEEIDGTEPSKYTRIISIAAQAHKLRRMTRKRERVADVMRDPYGPGGYGIGLGMGALHANGADGEIHAAIAGDEIAANDEARGGVGAAWDQIVGPRRQLHQPDPGDMMDLIRESLSVLKRRDDAPKGVAGAADLRALIDARAALRETGVSTDKVDAAIAKLAEALSATLLTDGNHDENEKGNDDAPHPALVHSELLRRHPAGGGGGEALPPDRGEDDGARKDGAGEAGHGGIEERVVADV